MRKPTIFLTAMLAVAFLFYVAQAQPNGIGERQAGSLPAKAAAPQTDEAAELPTVGLLVHVGCGTGEETLELAKRGSFVVHALEKELPKVRQAQNLIKAAGLYGQIAVEHWTSPHLPYADNLVNLLVASKADAPPQQEILRVLRRAVWRESAKRSFASPGQRPSMGGRTSGTAPTAIRFRRTLP